jgi:hypothetical protein
MKISDQEIHAGKSFRNAAVRGESVDSTSRKVKMPETLRNTTINIAAITPQNHTDEDNRVSLIRDRRYSFVPEGLHLPLKYNQYTTSNGIIAMTAHIGGINVTNMTQLPTPMELTIKPDSIERRTSGIFIQRFLKEPDDCLEEFLGCISLN